MTQNISFRPVGGSRSDSVFAEISERRRLGRDFEDCGDVDAAIENYAAAIEIGESCGLDVFHAYVYAYDRIIALLFRLRRFVTFDKYCEMYLKHPLHESTRNRIINFINKSHQ